MPNCFQRTLRPDGILRRRFDAEVGAGLIEILVAGAVLAIVILGSTVVFSMQKQTVSKDLGIDALRDVISIVHVDAAAIQAYDPSARAVLNGSGQQVWAVPFGGTALTNLVTIQARPAANGLSVIAKGTGQQASLIIPLPAPQATPQ